MKANLFLALNKCSDVFFYLTAIDTDLHILGLNENTVMECFMNDTHRLDSGIMIIPRRIVEIGEQRLEKYYGVDKSVLIGYVPVSTSVARRLAKTRRLSIVVITPSSLRFVDESQVNFMHQSGERNKYIEIHIYPFLKTSLNPRPPISIERMLYILGNTIERALKLDVGVVVSTASEDGRKPFSVVHTDIVLFYLGFTKRERRLIMDVYPTELLLTWLNYR